MLCFRMAFPLIAFLAFAIASSITPGPNNVMLAASAANRGVRAAVPMMIGINLGFALMVCIVGLGLATPLALYPRAQSALRWVGIAWMLVLAWKIARAGAPGTGEGRAQIGLVTAMMLQWVNPKAWLLAVATATSWVAADSAVAPQVIVMALLFFCVGLPSSLVWAGIGASAGRLLHSPGRLRVFNIAMAVLLVLAVLPLALGE